MPAVSVAPSFSSASEPSSGVPSPPPPPQPVMAYRLEKHYVVLYCVTSIVVHKFLCNVLVDRENNIIIFNKCFVMLTLVLFSSVTNCKES